MRRKKKIILPNTECAGACLRLAVGPGEKAFLSAALLIGAKADAPRQAMLSPSRVSTIGCTSPAGKPTEHDPEKWTPVFRKDHAPRKI
jgi:hypothetical protein